MITRVFIVLGALFLFSGCVTVPPKDYTAFHRTNPKSILVLPPINNSTEVIAPYSLLTTVTRPLSELGYYVVPVVLADHLLKENGLGLPAEMHAAPLEKLQSVFGVDAVLYITIDQYGSKYQVLSSNAVVVAHARMVDAHTGVEIWNGKVSAVAQGQSGLLEALVTQVMNKLVDATHNVAMIASVQLLMTPGQGLPPGPHSPDYGKPDPH